MTNEAINALMVLALYGSLEIALLAASIGRFAKRTVPSTKRRAGRLLTYRGSSSSVDGSI